MSSEQDAVPYECEFCEGEPMDGIAVCAENVRWHQVCESCFDDLNEQEINTWHVWHGDPEPVGLEAQREQ